MSPQELKKGFVRGISRSWLLVLKVRLGCFYYSSMGKQFNNGEKIVPKKRHLTIFEGQNNANISFLDLKYLKKRA